MLERLERALVYLNISHASW